MEKKNLSEILQSQKVHKDDRDQLARSGAMIDAHLINLRKQAIEAVKNGETTGDKLRDAIVLIIGCTSTSIERYLQACLADRGVFVDKSADPIMFTEDEFVAIETFLRIPDLSLRPETETLLARVFGVGGPPVTQEEMDEILATARVGNKICAPFPGMHLPWTEEKKEQFRKFLEKYPPADRDTEPAKAGAGVHGKKWSETIHFPDVD